MAFEIMKGSIVRARVHTGVCDVGMSGVCYEIYELSGRFGYGILFADGRADGFSPDEVRRMLEVTERISPVVRDYIFTNVCQLDVDYRQGRFRECFEK